MHLELLDTATLPGKSINEGISKTPLRDNVDEVVNKNVRSLFGTTEGKCRDSGDTRIVAMLEAVGVAEGKTSVRPRWLILWRRDDPCGTKS